MMAFDYTPEQYAVIERGGPVEYGEVSALDLPVSHATILRQEIVCGRNYRLVHKTSGFRCAGSAMIWRDHDVWVAQVVSSGGTPSGREFREKAEAETELERWMERRFEEESK